MLQYFYVNALNFQAELVAKIENYRLSRYLYNASITITCANPGLLINLYDSNATYLGWK